MKPQYKKIIVRSSIAIIGFALIFGLSFVLTPYGRFAINKKAVASSGLPYQVGLTNVVLVPCVWVVASGVCTGGTLCPMVDPAQCNLTTDIAGTPAGGMGSEITLSTVAVSMIGVVPGGQIIAGGIGPTMINVAAGMAGKWGF